MTVKTIQMITKPAAFMTAARRQRAAACGSIGRQNAVFVKKILEQHAILNDLSGNACLVFLEHAAAEQEREQQILLLSVKLLAFLMQNAQKQESFFHAGTFFAKQLAGQIAQSLQEQKASGLVSADTPGRCCLEYQKLSQVSRQASGAENSAAGEQYFLLEKQLVQFQKKQEQKMLDERGRLKKAVYAIPVLMTHSFFASLNRCLRENKMPDYQTLWRSANRERILQDIFCKHMQRFLAEPDMLKQEMQMADMLRQFGKETLLKYLERADLQVYETILPAVQALSGIKRDVPQEAGSIRRELADGASELADGISELADGVSELADGTSELADGASELVFASGEMPEAGRDEVKQLLASYQETEAQIEMIFARGTQKTESGTQSFEITKNMLLEKAEEYKERFYHAMRRLQGENEAKAAPDAEGISQKEDVSGTETDSDAEVFTDAELKLLLSKAQTVSDAGSKQQVQTASGDGSEQENEALETAQRRLNLIALREIAGQFLLEDSSILHKQLLQEISQLLEKVPLTAPRHLQDTDALKKERNQDEVWNMRQSGSPGLDTPETYGAVLSRITASASPPQRKLIYFMMEKAADEMLMEIQQPDAGRSLETAQLVQIKEQLGRMEANPYNGAGGTQFWESEETGRKLIQLLHSKDGSGEDMLGQRVYRQLTAFYRQMENDRESGWNSVRAEWQPLFQPQEWQLLQAQARPYGMEQTDGQRQSEQYSMGQASVQIQGRAHSAGQTEGGTQGSLYDMGRTESQAQGRAYSYSMGQTEKPAQDRAHSAGQTEGRTQGSLHSAGQTEGGTQGSPHSAGQTEERTQARPYSMGQTESRAKLQYRNIDSEVNRNKGKDIGKDIDVNTGAAANKDIYSGRKINAHQAAKQNHDGPENKDLQNRREMQNQKMEQLLQYLEASAVSAQGNQSLPRQTGVYGAVQLLRKQTNSFLQADAAQMLHIRIHEEFLQPPRESLSQNSASVRKTGTDTVNQAAVSQDAVNQAAVSRDAASPGTAMRQDAAVPGASVSQNAAQRGTSDILEQAAVPGASETLEYVKAGESREDAAVSGASETLEYAKAGESREQAAVPGVSEALEYVKAGESRENAAVPGASSEALEYAKAGESREDTAVPGASEVLEYVKAGEMREQAAVPGVSETLEYAKAGESGEDTAVSGASEVLEYVKVSEASAARKYPAALEAAVSRDAAAWRETNGGWSREETQNAEQSGASVTLEYAEMPGVSDVSEHVKVPGASDISEHMEAPGASDVLKHMKVPGASDVPEHMKIQIPGASDIRVYAAGPALSAAREYDAVPGMPDILEYAAVPGAAARQDAAAWKEAQNEQNEQEKSVRSPAGSMQEKSVRSPESRMQNLTARTSKNSRQHTAVPSAKLVHTKLSARTAAAGKMKKDLSKKKAEDAQQKQAIQKLAGSLLDAERDLKTKTVRLQQLEQKLSEQEKDLQRLHSSHKKAAAQLKPSVQRRKLLEQMKAAFQLERMRNGADKR